MNAEITEYDPASGICVVRDHYKLDSDGYLEVKKKVEKKEGVKKEGGPIEYDRVADLDKAEFMLVRSFEIELGERAGRKQLKNVFIEGKISVKPDPDAALKDFHDGFVLYDGFNTYWQFKKGLPDVIIRGKFLHVESEKCYEVAIGDASITQPLKQREYAFIATNAGITPPHQENESTS